MRVLVSIWRVSADTLSRKTEEVSESTIRLSDTKDAGCREERITTQLLPTCPFYHSCLFLTPVSPVSKGVCMNSSVLCQTVCVCVCVCVWLCVCV